MSVYLIPSADSFSWQAPVKDRDLSIPPVSPNKGDRYIIGQSPSGAWAGFQNYITYWDGNLWKMLESSEGWKVWVEDEDSFYFFSSNQWNLQVKSYPLCITLVSEQKLWTDVPVALTEFVGGQTIYRTKLDLTNFTWARLVAREMGVNFSSYFEIRIQYSLNGAVWDYLDGVSGPKLGPFPTFGGTLASPYILITLAAKADVFIRIVGINGDGATDLSFSNVMLQLK